MEKNEFGSILIYLIMFGLLYLVGQTVIVLVLNSIEAAINQFAYILLCTAVSLVLFTIVYELGHVAGARIGKYKCIYFNLFGLCLYKDNEKWKIKLDSFDGLFSETRFVPINNEAKSNTIYQNSHWSDIFIYFELFINYSFSFVALYAHEVIICFCVFFWSQKF